MAAPTSVRSRPRAPRLDRATAYRLATTEYDRTLAAWRALGPADWSRPTVCAAWDVRAMAAHTLGMTEMTASLRQLVHQNAAASRAGGGIDALTAVQVRERAGLSPAELVDRLAAAAPRAVRGRRRLSVLLGAVKLPEEQVVGPEREWWRIGFLTDVVLTRDPWMHRMDLAAATGTEPVLTADHDGVLVADVVAEWAGRHGQPYRLRLTGPAGGEWSSGADGGADVEAHELDAVDFCRVLSGRGTGDGLLAQQVPF
ncbi:maleylpyruvate isomerase family mycothiol-dependent enzyme [Geodermatophilus sp. YIM 151500]|uniref:maleylpyruvate isomerase family mycothiol-dependent enzyme n=1 Tax=Geodermatophilus sp. YIM 151500 TaxID=2984531 RepID=UPI0021E3CE2F|nr:maleylpyruvate isomerase family mycothiol-dependent enzyme [Geodermatophilus sp. YIM 151500]MCV2491006.1 maleylpyruvate isomerase family mycothiol-dependent enzyme [Geodermatophilus sp. YIM 151500]